MSADVAVAYVRNMSKLPYHIAIGTRVPETHRPVGLRGKGPTFVFAKAICGAVIYMWADGEVDGMQLEPVCRNCARTKKARGLR